MHPGLLAFASGGFLYIASAAVGSLHGPSEIQGLAWLGVAAVALCHAGLGFFAIGDLRPAAPLPSTGILVGRAVASLLMTALALAIATAAVSLFPLSMTPGVALTLVAVSVLASAVALTLTVGRLRREQDS